MVITIRSFAASPPPPGTVFLAGEDRAPTVEPASLRRRAADTLSHVRVALTTCDLPSSCRRRAVARSAFATCQAPPSRRLKAGASSAFATGALTSSLHRKGFAWGKTGSVRVGLGGRRI